MTVFYTELAILCHYCSVVFFLKLKDCIGSRMFHWVRPHLHSTATAVFLLSAVIELLRKGCTEYKASKARTEFGALLYPSCSTSFPLSGSTHCSIQSFCQLQWAAWNACPFAWVPKWEALNWYQWSLLPPGSSEMWAPWPLWKAT